MAANKLEGSVSYVNHEKQYVMIEYEAGGKKRNVKGTTKDHQHIFTIGDIVGFRLDHIAGTDKQMAGDMEFRFNSQMDVLLQKAKLNNSFLGYLKQVDDDFFVKEIESYLFFKMNLSRWQLAPKESKINEPVAFFLDNIDKKAPVTAVLFDNDYLPEFHQAMKLYKAKTPIESEVYKVSPHGIYLNLIGDALQGKIPADTKGLENVKPGDKISVIISFLSKDKIVVTPAE